MKLDQLYLDLKAYIFMSKINIRVLKIIYVIINIDKKIKRYMRNS